ncbi:MAG: diphosphate--fructose-6-phosphate 1-phosphotransferase, partial [Fibrobacteraceae bacterium]|nr:diphosphate--fructose-6-phosphate 1-phosphotransferase [Fibrobacteraceae bacterium]
MADNLSVLGKARKAYQPKLPVSLRKGALNVQLNKGKATESVRDQKKIKALFPNTYGAPYVSLKAGKASTAAKPLNVGVVLSGGQAPGGHNVIAGLFDGIKSIHKNSKLLGFLGGPSGLENGKFIVINEKIMDSYRNTG